MDRVYGQTAAASLRKLTETSALPTYAGDKIRSTRDAQAGEHYGRFLQPYTEKFQGCTGSSMADLAVTQVKSSLCAACSFLGLEC